MANFSEDFDADKTKDDVAQRLEQHYPDRSPEELKEVASETVDEFAGAPVTGFIDNIAEHEARARLDSGDEPDPA